jgi:hypothetical protein
LFYRRLVLPAVGAGGAKQLGAESIGELHNLCQLLLEKQKLGAVHSSFSTVIWR